MKRISQWGSTACISMMGLMISQISMADGNHKEVNMCVKMIAEFCKDSNHANENDSLVKTNKKLSPCNAYPNCNCENECLLARCLSKN